LILGFFLTAASAQLPVSGREMNIINHFFHVILESTMITNIVLGVAATCSR